MKLRNLYRINIGRIAKQFLRITHAALLIVSVCVGLFFVVRTRKLISVQFIFYLLLFYFVYCFCFIFIFLSLCIWIFVYIIYVLKVHSIKSRARTHTHIRFRTQSPSRLAPQQTRMGLYRNGMSFGTTTRDTRDHAPVRTLRKTDWAPCKPHVVVNTRGDTRRCPRTDENANPSHRHRTTDSHPPAATDDRDHVVVSDTASKQPPPLRTHSRYATLGNLWMETFSHWRWRHRRRRYYHHSRFDTPSTTPQPSIGVALILSSSAERAFFVYTHVNRRTLSLHF